MPTCDHCDAHISEQFRAVFADERGEVLACPNCSANSGIADESRRRSGSG
ncbi:DUF7563 family protein [Halomarina rubra]|uniref:Small CPxCG-related zinc finger protein n=1 Tax=Halomarina rubra TaxID=2071873 RepID=A0ABD6ASM9_9EURY|nr:hypothetical protein [Halomarina rubra]